MVGYEAGRNNTGSNNVFLGKATGKGTGSGSQTIAIGQGVMETASQIDNSVLIGNYMAANCTSGAGSTVAIGTNCLSVSGYSGEANTAVGFQAADNLASGDQNTLIGREAGKHLTTTSDNVFLGYLAGRGKTSGTISGANNVAIGSDCYTTMTSGSNNVVIGYRTLGGVGEQSGTNNVFIGQSIYYNSYFSGSNSTVIGSTATPSAQNVSNEITLGNSSISTLRCQQTSITALSDERDKKDIETLPYGLDFVDSLKPKKFVWDHRAETDSDGNEFFSNNKGKKDIGFIAQELQNVDDDYLNLVFDSNPEKLEATYGRLIPVLVKAIQDLSAKVKALENA